jgi:hypothetical protein
VTGLVGGWGIDFHDGSMTRITHVEVLFGVDARDRRTADRREAQA